jgi:hypothetical protein
MKESMNKKQMLGGVGGFVAGQVARQHVGENKLFDVKLGSALLKDRRVPVGTKLMAMALGIALVTLIEMLEIPIETIVAFLLPIVGIGLNIAVDGLEYVAGSLLFAALLVPHLAPKTLVQQIRGERTGEPIPVEMNTKPR